MAPKRPIAAWASTAKTFYSRTDAAQSLHLSGGRVPETEATR